MKAAESSGGGGGGARGDIDSSVAPTTALAGEQVKEGGTAPTGCFRKRKGRKWRGSKREFR